MLRFGIHTYHSFCHAVFCFGRPKENIYPCTSLWLLLLLGVARCSSLTGPLNAFLLCHWPLCGHGDTRFPRRALLFHLFPPRVMGLASVFVIERELLLVSRTSPLAYCTVWGNWGFLDTVLKVQCGALSDI